MFDNSAFKKNIICFVCFLLTATAVSAQSQQLFPKVNSPYSRFGLGNLIEQYFIANAGMAGVSSTFQDAFHMNVVNPASLSYLQSTAFEVGLFAQSSTLVSPEAKDQYWTGNLRYLALGFPLKNPINQALDKAASPWSFGMGFSLIPFSLIGYNVEDHFEDANIGSISNTLKGNGGTYRIMWSNAVRYKNLSIGAGIGSLFGELTDSRRIQFDSLDAAYNVDLSNDIGLNGFIWNFGAQYTFEFKKLNSEGVKVNSGNRIIAGIYGNGNSNFKTTSSTVVLGDNLAYGVIDTLFNGDEIKGKGVLPAELGFGLMFQKINKYRFGFDFKTAKWSKYSNEAKPDNFSNSWRFALGGEYIPNLLSINSYFDKARYRFGLFFGEDFRSIGQDQLGEFGITAGIGLPIFLPRQSISFLNIALEYSRLGISDGLKEKYFKINFGFTLNDNSWFFKQKFY